MAFSNPRTPKLRKPQILEELRRVESQLRYMEAHAPAAGPNTKSGMQSLAERELEESAIVDIACIILAAEVAKRMQVPHLGSTLTVIDASILCLVILRVMDAQRFLSGCPALPKNWPTELHQFLHELLYNRWHSYAEPYWLRRRECLTNETKEDGATNPK